jgi:GNAT superfamily N-acetyltransferase
VEDVRPAGPDDLDRCAELLAGARRQARQFRGGDRLAVAGPERATVDRWVAEGPNRSLLVGIFAGATVGLATGHLAETGPTGPRRLGRLDCCYVEPAARRVGVGEALVTQLLTWFAAQGCTDVDAPALPGDRDSKQLYETAGFKARLLVLHRPLP